jgi:large subunit ribosomal protein L6
VSRIGRKPVDLPSGVVCEKIADGVRVKGPAGTVTERLPAAIGVEIGGGQVRFTRPDDRKPTRALHGLARALVANMVRGVTTPFVRELEIQGVGYRADVSGRTLRIQVGFSHPVEVPIPEGIKVSVDKNVLLRLEGVNRQQVGLFAADLRAIRPPEPYKGKGIRYADERVSLKETKKK